MTAVAMNSRKKRYSYDRYLLFAIISLLVLGLVMVTSTSVFVSEKQFHGPFHFLFRQVAYLALGIIFASIIIQIKLKHWRQFTFLFLLLTFALLLVVLIPGIGHEVNGSTRWIGFGPISIQASELAKFFMIIYLADYLVRRDEEVRNDILGFLKPMLLLSIMALLLLKEPDYGAAVVMIATALTMMFLAGVRLWQFAILFAVVALALVVLAISSPYRLERLTTFLNPWANQYDSGYQLTQALIAFGRGGWFGVGLGDSIQKLFYLPEAHTDFVFAVYAEEMGLLGVLVVIGLFVILITRGLIIARKAERAQHQFAAYVAYGFSTWIAMQALINMGVNSGLLPTKGLTLPLMSYGGSSMLVMSFVLAMLIRIDYEHRITQSDLKQRGHHDNFKK